MQPKKNPDIDAKRNSLLYFQIGLVAITILTYIAIEVKTIDPVIITEKVEIVDSFIDEEIIPLTMRVQKVPPPPPPAPEVIQIVEDKVVIEKEKKIETTETSEKQEVVVVKAAEVGEVGDNFEDIDVDVPFAILEDIPIFPGCENAPRGDKQKQCFAEKMEKHIRKYQNYPERAKEDDIQGRVIVMFIIDKTGAVTNLRIKGPKGGKMLNDEAERVIKKLPKFIPGKQRGRPVSVSYAQPITFKLQ